MQVKKTTAIKKIAKLKNRIRAVQGGTAAGKTIGIVGILFDLAAMDKTPTITSIVSESFPHLKRGVMRDFLWILESLNRFDERKWNKTDYIYTLSNGSKIEFFSADQPSKVRGPRRDRLFLNEANNIPYETFDQLEVRTNEFVFLDWNPVVEYWFDNEVKLKRQDIDHLILTYKDNEALNPEIIKSIEQRKGNRNWWQVYGMGLLGEIEGKIYRDWEIIDEIPREARLERYGLDFGYTNDPTAIVAIFYYQGSYILHEVCFQRGMSNKNIADLILANPKALVIADSAEPKSIDEIKRLDVLITAAEKGQDSVRNGIQLVQSQKIMITKSSVNMIKEYRNYTWETDKDGVVLNTPEHFFSHSMDAVRYGLVSLLKKPKIKTQASPLVKPYEY